MARRGAMQASLAFCFLWLAIGAQLSEATPPRTKFYEFNITEKKITRLCSTKSIIVVNNQFPGPQIDVEEGDSLEIKVNNFINHNITLHWHGIFQNRTGWFDGPAYITQCPIQRQRSFVYKFDVVRQRGTLWWHAHITFLRATVYGALIVHPKQSFPFLRPGEAKPKELVVMLGEWWKSDVLDVIGQAMLTGAGTNLSDAFTINGLPGPLYGKCSQQDTQVFNLQPGTRYLLRLISAAMNTELFFGIANHTLTIVEADAQYVKPFTTPSLVISPGQAITALFTTDRDPSLTYSMAAHAFASAPPFIPFQNTTTAAILSYASPPRKSFPRFLLPSLPPSTAGSAFSDAFAAKLRSADRVRREFPLPASPAAEKFFITVGLNVQSCPPTMNPNISCALPVPGGGRFGASMNNVSFIGSSSAFLKQHFDFIHTGEDPSTYTTDFPRFPRPYNFTASPAIANQNAPEGTKARIIPYGATVEVVLQGTTLLAPENHPIHLHGFDFYVLATGRGNFNRTRDSPAFNLVDPPLRNTISVPAAGWAVIRFVADNPGTWVFHCHLDLHSLTGLDTVFIVEDGAEEWQRLEPPPKDLPPC
ncbi:hypothetical protein SELMODRAFT_404333 [Selaginella moellendorffii]|uniref:Laccase n=1 Tax=Selaginella moellendorffii TaxID=88036 RepID=D8QV04_SELML|nr:laccase-4 [Selaginella moellendorffii]EFJ35961.1 hypothetical protein SELMODRAFT_404333 [Selaginella moellendorffii]|eukprot:XP_002962498.1 laccase-4 [Selaginella moellendorffii]